MRHFFTIVAAVAVCLGLVSCEPTKSRTRERVLAQAFIGPITLNLRQEISPASKPAATAKHGETVDVLQVRRRFVRVRTPRGEVGWTDSRNLLTAEQMKAIADLEKRAVSMPSQGEATVYSPLNVHTDPDRNSTSFFQITESMRVDVLSHVLTPRTVQAPTPFRIPKPARPSPRRKSSGSRIPPPPLPPAPGLPSDWMELSKSNYAIEEPPPAPLVAGAKKRRAKAAKPSGPVDDWYLVRAKNRKAGWVLARMLNMAIPDEVAQYSEGARITSYFPLADVRDGDVLKHHWLWTTIRDGQQPYQFDSFRVFTYVVRRHRYETSYIERDVEGYYPVEATSGRAPRFSLILRGDDGNLYRKTYVMDGYLVRKISELPYKKEEIRSPVISNLPPPPDEKDTPESLSIGERIKNFFKRTSTE